MRVALVPRSTEIKPLFWRFVKQINPPYMFHNVGGSGRKGRALPEQLLICCLTLSFPNTYPHPRKFTRQKFTTWGAPGETRPLITIFISAGTQLYEPLSTAQKIRKVKFSGVGGSGRIRLALTHFIGSHLTNSHRRLTPTSVQFCHSPLTRAHTEHCLLVQGPPLLE
jgi:hypothetical protein